MDEFLGIITDVYCDEQGEYLIDGDGQIVPVEPKSILDEPDFALMMGL